MKKIEYLSASLPHGLKCQYLGIISYDFEYIDNPFGTDRIDTNYVYGIKIGNLKEIHVFKKYWRARCGIKSKGLKSFINGNGLTPIIRPPSDLTKPITQANYNEGKEFVPIVELAKVAFGSNFIKQVRVFGEDEYCVEFIGRGDNGGDNPEYMYNPVVFSFSKYHFSFSVSESDTHCAKFNQLQLFQLLWKWHFWPNMPEGEEVVWVTNEFNPYE
jgi:hypothetical protein